MAKFQVHRIHFFNPEPKAIHCLSFEEESCSLAVVRADFSIEIWNLKEVPYQEKIIPGHPDNSVESVVWCKGRLFSAGLHAHIIEYDLIHLVPKHSIPLSSGSIWCLDLNKEKTVLAAGTEEGCVGLFRITESDINFDKTLKKHEGRILCLAWHESGEVLVTGSINTIRIWDIQTGSTMDEIMLGRLEKNMETIVWSVYITRDFTIISGDSTGQVSFWDGKTGTLLNAMNVHKADVLTLCITKDEKSVYASGVDPVIVEFTRVDVHTSSMQNLKKQWMKSIQRSLHSHDVRALQISGNYLVSGGMDTYLSFSKFPPKDCVKYSPYAHISHCHVASEARCLLLHYPNMLELWKLGSTRELKGMDGDVLPLNSQPVKLLQLKCKEGESVNCCAISSNASWLAYSTSEELRLFNLYENEDTVSSDLIPSPQKVKWLPEECQAAHSLSFVPSGEQLVIATQNGALQILRVNLLHPVLVHSFSPQSEPIERIHLLAINCKGKYVACGDHKGRVRVYDLKEYKVHCSLPSYKCQPTALAFRPKSTALVVVYSNRKLIEYSIKKQAYTKWSRHQPNLQASIRESQLYPITGISFNPEKKNLIILHDESSIYVLTKRESDEGFHKVKKGRKESENVIEKENTSMTVSHKYKHLLAFSCLEQDSMIAVEILPSILFQHLPPPLQKKKFGT